MLKRQAIVTVKSHTSDGSVPLWGVRHGKIFCIRLFITDRAFKFLNRFGVF